MRWKQCTGSTHQNPPSARMGHLAVFVDAKGTWGEELLLIHVRLQVNSFLAPVVSADFLKLARQVSCGSLFFPASCVLLSQTFMKVLSSLLSDSSKGGDLAQGGLSEEKYALGDLAVLQTGTEAWFHPKTDGKAAPLARAFHCGCAIGPRVYVFGGHVWVKEKKGLEKFNDLWCLNTVRLLLAPCTAG